MATTATMTGAQFDALSYDEGRRWELINGELTPVPSPTWRHQRIVFRILLALDQYLKASNVNGQTAQDVEFSLTADDRVRPDGCAVFGEKADRLDHDKIPIPGAPDLAVEIISPSESAVVSHEKVRRYLQYGTSEVWQVFPRSRTIQIHRGDVSTVVGSGGLVTSALLPSFEVSAASFFE
jgi:Uma2 family endonuclease